MIDQWMRLGMQTTMLALEAQQVIGLRMMRLAQGGPGALRETERMVTEKAFAAIETGLNLARGQDANDVVRAYRRKVRANRTRLIKQKP